MKTKTNKVPLVGPKGRRELLAKINELEEKVAALESAPKNESHLLEILSTSDEGESESSALSRLKLDGNAVSLNDLRNIDIRNTIVTMLTLHMSISSYEVGVDTVTILGGITIDSAGYQFAIYIDGNNSSVREYEY